MSKIVVTDYGFADLKIESAILSRAGHVLVANRERRPPADTAQLVRDADAVITQFAQINAQVIAAMNRARVIVRYGIGVDNVDLLAARNQGIPVCNIPDYCVDEVADHTLAFILAMLRQVAQNASWLREGRWGLATPIESMAALSSRTVGIVGFGRIGRQVVRRLIAHGARVLVFDPVVASADIVQAGAQRVLLLDDLLSASDVVSPHCPSNANTKGIFNAERFARMKRGAIFINVSRGDLADTTALIAALQNGGLSGAALDVCDPEPIPTDSPLRTMPNVILSSHIASCSPRAVQILRETAAELVRKALQGEPLPNVVNGVVH